MVGEVYSESEIKDLLSNLTHQIYFTGLTIADNNKRYKYDKDMVEEYKRYADLIIHHAKTLKRLINEMKIYKEKTSKNKYNFDII